MFEVRNISKKFKPDFWKSDFVALKDVSFKVEKGDIVGFLGANGAGKTTLLKIVLGFITASDGEIIFHENLGKRKNPFEKIGYMPERPYYYGNLNGREFLEYCGQLNNLKDKELKVQIEKWTKVLKIDYALDRKISSYSKGMLQRLGFSSALLHDPLLIILDEPLSGLDPIGRKDFKDILVELNKKGVTVFFSSHIVSDVEEVCKHVVVLEKGELIFSGEIKKIISDNSEDHILITLEENEKIEEKYKAKVQQRNAEGVRYVIEAESKKSFIKDVDALGGEIISLVRERKTLEEVIYKLRDAK
ncbi:ABC transporter ATP-binding protein [Bacteriovorax sp. Seq25_V]|uniref:ABC transporter ATP-binding protein n=1 Tax=Bacteriovorax sp. Seq25_V TaxID=1201288 RepID=UPI00038A374D|nr:ABC transporter ATP-binding protein [Bacteriovorax sp. Seq25_V]EQC43391.1 ABC transporter, ATP-binding protein [Bacteriovorax sp. Seq25_V]